MTKRTTLSRTVIITAIAGATLFGAGLAQARPGPDGPMPSFQDLDANGDGQLTKDEVQARAALRFAQTDTNGDGMLSAEEMVAAAEMRMDERRKQEAGKIAKRTERMIERQDANGDGMLTLAELAPQSEKRADRMFEHLDDNGDGVISLDEFEDLQARMMKRKGMKPGDH